MNKNIKSGTGKNTRAFTSGTPSPAPSGGSSSQQQSGKLPVDLAARQQARTWPLQQVKAELIKLSTHAAERALVVGEWLWVQFPHPPIAEIRAGLSQLGFHWSSRRQCWKHPC